jgi:hypothetical protein
MGRFPSLVRYGSKLVLEILPSVAATVIGGYLLTQLHFSRAPEPPAQPQQAAAEPAAAPSTPEVPTVREDRAAMRELLKERRENPEPPAVVRPVLAAAPAPASAPAAPPAPANPPPPVTAQLPPAMDSIAPNEPIERAAAPARPNIAAAPVALPRVRPESVASVYAPAPPPGLPPAAAVGVDAPLQVAPAAPVVAPAAPVVATVGPVAASPVQPPGAPPATPAPRRGVFSAFSSIVGGAASATGNTVNWVIDLPGKAIEAGGRVIGIDPAPPPNRPFS